MSVARTASRVIEPLPVVDRLMACCSSLEECCVPGPAAKLAAQAFRALADPMRVRLLALIAASKDGALCVCDLVDAVDLTQPTVSHHLKVLLDAGLLERERRGSWAIYRVRRAALRDLASVLGA